jgi:predicted enzyme related to lactoylglutathione lyase
MAAPVMHFEVNLKDARRGHEFYSQLFGWKLSVMPEMNYGMVDTGVKMGINGGLGQQDVNGQPGVTFYVQVEDIQSYLDRAVSLGGRVIFPPHEVPNMVTFAQFADFEGNVLGLIKGPQSIPKAAATKRKAAKKKVAKRKTAKGKATSKRKKTTAKRKR